MQKIKSKHIKVICISIALAFTVMLGTIYNYNTSFVFYNGDKKLPIYSVNREDKKISLTFDASAGEDETEKILEVLDKYNIKATFFLVGDWINTYPDKLKLLHEKGHEIGNHTNTHPDMTKISKEKMINEIATLDAKIMEATGEKTKLFRCPSGAYNSEVIETVESTNHKVVQWDVDSIDWKEKGADLEYNRVIEKTDSGSILLFHNNAKYTPENLPRIIEELQGKGYEFVTVSELIFQGDYYLDHTGKQFKNNKN